MGREHYYGNVNNVQLSLVIPLDGSIFTDMDDRRRQLLEQAIKRFNLAGQPNKSGPWGMVASRKQDIFSMASDYPEWNSTSKQRFP